MTAEEIIEKNKDCLKENDLEGFYVRLRFDDDISWSDISKVTQYFYEMGADPLEYMDEIPEYFLAKADIKSFTIPNHIEKIYYSAFYGCGLKSITIPKSVTYIDNEVFDECGYLESIEILDGIRTINYATFRHCNNLKSIKLPDTIERIGNWAFRGCRNLTDINVPKNLKKVGENAFDECPDEIKKKFKKFM